MQVAYSNRKFLEVQNDKSNKNTLINLVKNRKNNIQKIIISLIVDHYFLNFVFFCFLLNLLKFILFDFSFWMSKNFLFE